MNPYATEPSNALKPMPINSTASSGPTPLERVKKAEATGKPKPARPAKQADRPSRPCKTNLHAASRAHFSTPPHRTEHKACAGGKVYRQQRVRFHRRLQLMLGQFARSLDIVLCLAIALRDVGSHVAPAPPGDRSDRIAKTRHVFAQCGRLLVHRFEIVCCGSGGGFVIVRH